MARFCPGMTLHKPIRTDAGHATLQDLRQEWVGGGWVPALIFSIFQNRTNSQRCEQTANLAWRCRGKTQTCVCLPQAYALCLWTQAFRLSRHLVSLCLPSPHCSGSPSTRLSMQAAGKRTSDTVEGHRNPSNCA